LRRNHAAGVVHPLTALSSVTKMSEKRKSTSPSAIQAKKRQKTIVTKIRLLSRLEKRERIVDVGCNFRFARTSFATIHDNADRITESDKSEMKRLCSTTATVLSE